MHINRILKITAISSLLTAAIIALMFKFVVSPLPQIDTESLEAFVFQLVGVSRTVLARPLALTMMVFPYVRRHIQNNPQQYLRWAVIRLWVLDVPLCYDTVCYFLTGETASYGYMALMVVVAYLFVWPTRGRYESECLSSYDNEIH